MTEIKDICRNGIYLLYLDDSLRYIGKSKDVYKRFVEHKGQFPFNKAVVFPVPDFCDGFDNRNLLDIERRLIYLYSPPENSQCSKGAYREKPFCEKAKEIVNWYLSGFDELPNDVDVSKYKTAPNTKNINDFIEWVITKEYELGILFERFCP